MQSTLTHPAPVTGPASTTALRFSWPAGTVHIAVALALAIAWWGVRVSDLRAGSETGYRLGVAGGIAMLLLFVYPLRKRVPLMASWGPAKWWFVMHMVLGIGGPLLILVHSTFRVGSLNAGVALFSMLIVGASGVVGRFLYVQVHCGLHGERASLAELQHELGLQQLSVQSVMACARDAENVLLDFESFVLSGPADLAHHLRAFTLVPMRRRWTYQHCAHLVRAQIRRRARAQRWDLDTARKEYREQRKAMREYLMAVQRVAQFQSATRLFSLWHVLHVPFVYLMVLCAVVHVVAVHAY
ncbi:MAG TPA: hypothetical protein VN663_11135 [Ramlibacter sp.]|nr:hypothetical protein [Ramlibacter sp.]